MFSDLCHSHNTLCPDTSHGISGCSFHSPSLTHRMTHIPQLRIHTYLSCVASSSRVCHSPRSALSSSISGVSASKIVASVRSPLVPLLLSMVCPPLKFSTYIFWAVWYWTVSHFSGTSKYFPVLKF